MASAAQTSATDCVFTNDRATTPPRMS